MECKLLHVLPAIPPATTKPAAEETPGAANAANAAAADAAALYHAFL